MANPKHQAHELMRMMWGDTKKGQHRAYMWLMTNLNIDVHFSQIDDYKEIDYILRELTKRAIRKGFLNK